MRTSGSPLAWKDGDQRYFLVPRSYMENSLGVRANYDLHDDQVVALRGDYEFDGKQSTRPETLKID